MLILGKCCLFLLFWHVQYINHYYFKLNLTIWIKSVNAGPRLKALRFLRALLSHNPHEAVFNQSYTHVIELCLVTDTVLLYTTFILYKSFVNCCIIDGLRLKMFQFQLTEFTEWHFIYNVKAARLVPDGEMFTLSVRCSFMRLRASFSSRFDMLANLFPSFNTLLLESGKPNWDIMVSV